MKINLPGLDTQPETDIVSTFLLMPVWWLLGFSVFVYQIFVGMIFIKLLIRGMKCNQSLRVPNVAFLFGLFLIFYLLSILINVNNHPSQRIFASLNNYSMLVMGFLMLLVIYNSDADSFFSKLLMTARILCVVTGILGIVFLGMWYLGDKDWEVHAWLAHKMPRLLDYPYTYNLVVITGALTDWFSFAVPRLTIYSAVPTATGGLMLMLTPMMLAYYALRKKRLERVAILALALSVLFFSISRAAIYGFIGGWVFVNILERGKTVLFAFLNLIAILFVTGYFYQIVEWVLNVRRPSTMGRWDLYQEALRIVRNENILMGIGAKLREEFTMQAIGSHALYIEIIFVAGLIGFSLFLLFQIFMIVNWYSQKKWLRNKNEKILWRYLGMSLLAMDIWLCTDTLLALPFITYAYFLIVAGILLLGKELKKEKSVLNPA